MPSLTASELDAYREDGYVVPSYRLPQAQVAALTEALEAVIADNPDVRPEQLVSVHLEGDSEGVVNGHAAFLSIARDPQLLDLVSNVIGDDIVLWGCQVFCKPGDDGMKVPMHQDGQYWPIRPLATCTVWIAIDDSDRGNGCLSVIPGSHRERVHFDHVTSAEENLVLNQAVDDERAAVRAPVCVELESGQFSMHDVYLVHGSAPNTSGRRRAGLAIRYMPATSHFRRDLPMPFSGYPVDFANRPLWLVKGRDVSGKNDFRAGHPATV